MGERTSMEQIPDDVKPDAKHVRYLKQRMCAGKQSFKSRQLAQKIAAKFGHSVYECPICFCWHCTHLANWQDEFVRKSYMDRRLQQQEAVIRRLESEIETLRKEREGRDV